MSGPLPRGAMRHGEPGVRCSLLLSPPRENVLFVPHENVLLTRSSWQDGKRSPADDPERSRPAGGIEESTEEVDPAAPGSRGIGDYRTASASDAGEAEGSGRPVGGARAARTALQPETESGGAGESRADSLAGSLPGFRTDTGQPVPIPEAPREDRPRSPAAADDDRRPMAGPQAEGRSHPPVASAAELARRDGAVGYL